MNDLARIAQAFCAGCTNFWPVHNDVLVTIAQTAAGNRMHALDARSIQQGPAEAPPPTIAFGG